MPALCLLFYSAGASSRQYKTGSIILINSIDSLFKSTAQSLQCTIFITISSLGQCGFRYKMLHFQGKQQHPYKTPMCGVTADEVSAVFWQLHCWFRSINLWNSASRAHYRSDSQIVLFVESHEKKLLLINFLLKKSYKTFSEALSAWIMNSHKYWRLIKTASSVICCIMKWQKRCSDGIWLCWINSRMRQYGRNPVVVLSRSL